MAEESGGYRIFLSAAEPSGDSHCAGLIRQLRSSGEKIEFVGVGGAKMEAAGCELIEVTAGRAAMIYNAFGQVVRFWRLIRRIRAYFARERVDLVIVCDSPAFNFHVAKGAKRAGVKTLFYVAPQLWAWAGWRIGKLRRLCDRLCCVLPFEEEWFGSRGVEAEFVGNPMVEGMECEKVAKGYEGFEAARARFSLMPGSRGAEIDTLWEPMQRIALRLKVRYPEASFTAVAVDEERKRVLRSREIAGFECEYVIGAVGEAARAADFAIAASGSATLQVAAEGCPMVIMYQSSRVLWGLIGWWLIKSRHLSLVNILAGREVVPEFMPYFTSVEPIVGAIENILDDRDKLSQISAKLLQLVEPLAAKKASEEVAEAALKMLGAKPAG